MSTTPQMSHMGLQQGQQFPSTSPYQQQPYGMGMSGTLEQLQQVALSAVQQVVQQVQALTSGVANGFIDIVHPLQEQPHQIFLGHPVTERAAQRTDPADLTRM
ncbi:hypothetical protein [Streptomyces sp. GESEQ-4]|uniref:hypothetical protein n=1 Tax=Streptomyces sp. GESEQ-4 TaxID=2812655 RepID=UPI001FF0C181|nr:hypothetical protein [Streptomyces sp. GESEQ-4]